MRVTSLATVAAFAVLIVASGTTWAQPGGFGGRGPGGRGSARSIMTMQPIVTTLDANADGAISAEEMENAPDALRKLDKDKDGELSENEVRPSFGGPRGKGPGFGGGQGPGGRGPHGLMRMLPIMTMLDADANGAISAEEMENASTTLKKLDRDDDGQLTEGELRTSFGPDRGGRGGQLRVERLKSFDRNEDGNLSKDELPAMMVERLLERADANGDSVIDSVELKHLSGTFGRGGPGASGLRIGEPAPDFDLPILQAGPGAAGNCTGAIGTQTVKLSSLRGKKVVCVFLTSYT